MNTFLGISNRDLSQKVPDSLPSFPNLALVLHVMQKPLMRGTGRDVKLKRRMLAPKAQNYALTVIICEVVITDKPESGGRSAET